MSASALLSEGGVGRAGRAWEVAAYRTLRALVRAVAVLFGRITVVGAENVPTEGAFVLAPVHRSNVDFALVALVTKRRMRYMGKDSIFKWGPTNRLIIALGAFPVHRGTADREALRVCIDIVQSGQPLVMFPEGTRQAGPVVEELFDGTVYVAAKAQVPIVPVGIGGSERVMPKGSKMIRPARLVLTVGEPIAPPAATDRGRVGRHALHEASEKLRGEIQILFDEAQARAGHPNPVMRG